ncbi:MAG: elongation factor G [Chloroflexi bacterium]|nr:elongation factor G [Chloroflexota bacterium]
MAVRNVGVVGHQGAGKTTLVESLAFAIGMTTRLGRVEEGNTISDHDAEEQQRGMSISTSLVSMEHNGVRINLLDTPGYADFIGEVVASVAVIDAVIVVVDASSGVQVGTETVWRMAGKRGIPRAVVISRLDRDNSSFEEALDSVQSILGSECQPLYLPNGSESSFTELIDVLGDEDADGREGLVEQIVEADEDLMMLYLEDEAIEADDLRAALKSAVLAGSLAPVLPMAAVSGVGSAELLRLIEEVMPEPSEAPAVAEGIDVNGATSAFVFKTTADEFVGRLSYLRVVSGTINSDAHLDNAQTGEDERLANISRAAGKTLTSVSELAAGDIGVVTKLQHTSTFSTLREKGSDLLIPGPVMPAPIFAAAVEPKTKADVDKLGPSLARLVEGDPTLQIERDRDSGETILSGLSESHVQLSAGRLLSKFHVEVEIKDRKVPYRETVTGVGQAEYLHKKQTGGSGQYARVALRVEPQPRGAGFEFSDEIVGGAVPRNYIPAVEKGVVESLPRGIFPLTDLRVVLFDGKHHDVDSSEMAFKLAATQALKEGVSSARPILLEPIHSLRITSPETSTGDIISDLNSRRARVLGMEPADEPPGSSVVIAEGPMAEFLHYATDLRSMTGGRGTFSWQFERYDPVPEHVAQKVRQDAAAAAAG